MAITAALKTQGTDTSNVASHASASITPTANKLLLAHILITAAGTTATVTASGNGLTWVQVATQNYGTAVRRLVLFRAMGASPSAGAVTFTLSETGTGSTWGILEFDGIDTSGTNGSGAIVQSVTNTGTATSGSVTLAAFGSADNGTYGCFGHAANEVHTPGSGFAELSDIGMAAPVTASMSEWRADNDTVVDASWTTSALWNGIGVEIKAASAVATSLIFGRQAHKGLVMRGNR